jgi:hypothetical protein
MIAVMNNYDFTWTILAQMEDKLTRVDVLGILETHKNCFTDATNYKLNTITNG